MRPVILLTLLLVLLSACSPAAGSQPASIATPTLTFTATSVVPTLTATLAPSATPYPTETPAPPKPALSATEGITPLPTIPTFTPTFDTRTIVTATPAPKAECPKHNGAIKLNFAFPDPEEPFPPSYSDQIIEFLNRGGSPDEILTAIQKVGSKQYAYKDVTGDGIRELMMADYGIVRKFLIFYCQAGHFQLFTYGSDNVIAIRAIQDLNRDGLPEVVISESGFTSSGSSFSVLSWKADHFDNLAEGMFSFGQKEFLIKDIDQDGIFEISITGYVPILRTNSSDYGKGYPWRDETHIYKWNEQLFNQTGYMYSAPEFRFQAIQDGDREASYGHYEQALAFYQKAIFNEKLSWWSPERKEYEPHLPEYQSTPTIFPTPIPDPTEYPRLAAYAYYRMVILHTALGQTDAAQLKYATLQQKFPAGDPGHPYVEMASAFWDAYQSSQKMYDACAAAIAYADAHPEILVPLGSDYHGWQSHIYVPADVCPFR